MFGENRQCHCLRLPWGKSIDYLVLVVFSVLIMVAAPLSGMVYDTARSFYSGYIIANSQSFPLQGPVLAGVLHAGPIWYYFISIPILFGSGLTGVIFWCKGWYVVTVIMAYKSGSVLTEDEQTQRVFGLCLVSQLLGFGWHSMTNYITAHTMYQWLCMLAVLCFLHRALKKHMTGSFFMSGLFFSLAIHAHPSAIILFPFVIYTAVLFGIGNIHLKWPIVLFSVGFLLAFLPYLTYQLINGWPDFYTSKAFIGSNLSADDSSSIVSMLKSVFIKGPIYAAEQFSAIRPGMYAVYQVLLFCIVAAVLFKKTNVRKKVTIIFIFLLITWLLIKIKLVTHFYMTFSHWLVISLIVAYAVTKLRHRTTMLVVMISIALTGQLMSVYSLSQTGNLGYTRIPGNLLSDIDNIKPPKYDYYPYINNVTRAALARYICNAQYQQIQFGGALALGTELSGGIEYLLECHQEAPQIFLKGLSESQTLIGLTPVQVNAKGGCVGDQVANICLEKPLVWEQTVDPVLLIADPAIYPPRQSIKTNHQTSELNVKVQLNQTEVLILTNALIAWMPWSVSNYGNNLSVIYEDGSTIMLVVKDQNETSHIKVIASRSDYVQVYKVARAGL